MPPNHILYPALRLILVNRLQKAVDCLEVDCLGTVRQPVELTSSVFTPDATFALGDRPSLLNLSLPSHSSPDLEKIPVSRVKRADQVWYVSPIALKLTLSNSQYSKQQTVNLAEKLAYLLNRDIITATTTTDLLPLDRIGQHFVAQIDQSGWIHFKLETVGLQEWLKVLCDRLPTFVLQKQDLPITALLPPSPDPHHQVSFAVLHAHARCCSLLRLGMQEQIVQLDPLNSKLAVWKIKNPDPIAWLNANGQLYCIHPAEQHLIAQIVNTLDELICNTSSFSTQQIWKLAQQLSQAFQQFDAECRIFGATKTDDRPLSQARLGLILITQALLNWMLRSGLRLSPPIAL